MIKKWEDFENKMTKYLEEILYDYDVDVNQRGNADSTIPDIEISVNNNHQKFYIETKMPISQSSQFVIEIKDNKFIYGNKNKFKSNEYSDEIIKILNSNFNLYKIVAKKRMIIPVPEEIAFGWITANMKNKGVEFMISVDNVGNEKIFPLERFSEIFNIKTIFRRKKSGSQVIPKKYYDDFKKHLNLRFSKYKYNLLSKNKKLFLELPLDLSKNECYIESETLPHEKRYFLSNKGSGKYEVRITSITNNPNIIFELSLKENVDFDLYTIQCLIDYINSIK